MHVRLLRDWKGYRAGKVFEPTLGAGLILIRRGIAAIVEAADQADASREAEAKKGKRKK